MSPQTDACPDKNGPLSLFQSRDRVSYAEINRRLEERDEPVSRVRTLMAELLDRGVEMIAEEPGAAGDTELNLPEDLHRRDTENALDHYMQQIGRHTLLSGEEEVTLARRIERGKTILKHAVLGTHYAVKRYLKASREVLDGERTFRDLIRVSQTEPVSDEEERAWFERISTARNRLIQHRTRWERIVGDLRESDDDLDDKRSELRQVGSKIVEAFETLGLDDELALAWAEDLQRGLVELVDSGASDRDVLEQYQVDEREGRLTYHLLELGREQMRRHKNRLMRCNLRLVVSIAQRYSSQGLGMADLIQEGNLGLRKAVDRFDYTKGYKFSTYATWWIRQKVTRALEEQSRTIRIPHNKIQKLNRLHRETRKFVQKHQREPTDRELAELLELSVDAVRDLKQIEGPTDSLDRPVGDHGEGELGDLIEDAELTSPEHEVASSGLKRELDQALESLDWREKQILRIRFGLDNTERHTYAEIGDMFNISRERARQIKQEALEKLRESDRLDRLRDYLPEPDAMDSPA